MHVHTVLVKLSDPTTIDHCIETMTSMRGRIDGMVSMDVQANEVAGNFSCDVALTTTWVDLEAYRRYEQDPVHLEVRAVVLDLMASATTLDYTLDQ